MENSKDLRDPKRFGYFSLHLRSKLNPKKKAKDSRNLKLQEEYERNANLCHLELQFEKKRNLDEGSQKTAERIDDGIFSMQGSSKGKISSVTGGKSEGNVEILNDSLSRIPSKMRWVPPLTEPSLYPPPSVKMTAKSDSHISTAPRSRPRVIRSSEDLRREVISQCKMIEAIGCKDFHHRVEETMYRNYLTDSVRSVYIPSISIPNTNHSQSTKSIAEEAGNVETINDSSSRLPSRMRCIPPLKLASFSMPPSGTMTSKSCSYISTDLSRRPRVICSSEDLRRKVISQCKMIEAIACEDFHNRVEKIMYRNKLTDSVRYVYVPSLSIPSTNPSQSRKSICEETGISTKSLPHLRLLKKISKASNPHAYDAGKHVHKKGDKDLEKNFNRKSWFSKGVQDDSSSRSFQDKGSHSEQDFLSNPMEITMGDLARQHFVNPLTTKLTKMCTQQLQMYLEVINGLEKSGKDFEQVLRNGALHKNN